MKQTTLTQRLLSALVALCMVLSVCAPALAADDRVIWIQKSGETVQLLNASTIGTKLPGCSYAYDGTTVTITMEASKEDVMADVTLAGGASTDIVLVCTNNTRMDNGRGLTITGMRNVTIKTADTSKEYTGAFYGALKVTECHGNVTVTNPHGAAVVYSLDVDNTAGTGNVTITGSNAKGSICAVAGAFGTNASIASNGDVKIENIVSGMFGAPLNYQAVDGELTVTSSRSVTTTGGASKVDITSTGAVEIKSDDTKNVVGKGLSVNAGGAVTVTGGGTGDNAAAIKGNATITAGRNVSIQNESGIAVDGNLTIDSSTGVTVVGNTQHNAVRYAANITSSGAVNISNSRGIAVGGKLTVKNASGTDNVTVTGTGNATLNNGADITSRGAVSITNTGSGLAVSGDLTVHDSGSVKVSGGNASAPAVDGNITLTSSDKMELSNPNGQVTNKKLTVKNSTGEVSVTGNKSDGSALVQGGASIDTTGAVTITNSSGPAIFSGLNVEQSGGITVTGSRASEPIITGSSTIKNTNKVEIINNGTNGQTAQSITYTPPAGKGYFYQTAQNGGKLHTRSAISSTTPYLCIEPDTLYTLTLPEGVTAKTNGISDTSFYAGEMVTVTAPEDTDTKRFDQWTFSGTEPTGLPDGWQNSKEFTFKMPAGNVTLKAEYKTAYTLTVDGGRGSFTVNGAARTQALEGETVTVKTSDTFFDAYRKFDGWKFTSGTEPTGLPDGWQNSPEFTFTMPADNVTLTADYKQLYDLTVTGGTIVDESSDTGKPSGIYLPGTEVTIQFTESDEITEQFKQWTGGENITDADPANWQNSERFTFTMPDSAVTLTAAYLQTYLLSEDTSKAEFFVDGKQVNQAPAGVRVTVKLVDGFINDHREFDQWLPAGGTALVDPDEGWEHKPSFSFIMPEGMVLLQAHTTFLYDVNVTHGTIVDETSETGTFQKIVKPGQLVTVRAESTEENPFLQWTYTGKAPVAPDDGWQTSKEFTFKMPEGNVTLEAQRDQLYKVSINDSLGSVTINGEQRSSLWVKEGETVTVATTLKDGYWMEFEKWNSTGTAPEEPEGGWTETNKSTSTTFTFKMPNGPVELVAQWSASPVVRPDPDEPLDEDFGVEPAPMDTTGGTIAAVAVGGAAIWGGYEIATRVILHSLLPEGAAIPASRGQLALLVWNTAGRPEPAGAPAFADVTDPDMAKAAQWCTEQGTMAAKGDRFEPEGWTPKFKVIEVWNKTFPAA